tara:strand:+ start:219 stop:380 length:162 start_codon:yes stop_codon:yes gene_type:complete
MRDRDKWKNVAISATDHAILKNLSDKERRSMASQLSVLIRKAFDEGKISDTKK